MYCRYTEVYIRIYTHVRSLYALRVTFHMPPLEEDHPRPNPTVAWEIDSNFLIFCQDKTWNFTNFQLSFPLV